MKFFIKKIIPGVLCVFLLNACVSSPSSRLHKADDVGQFSGLEKQIVRTSDFSIATYSRLSDSQQDLHIYIEGDGYAWVTPTRVSGDPTPRKPMLLSFAAKDPSANVIYIARPCQYVAQEMNPNCKSYYWTQGRFSDPVIQSMNEAVSFFSKKFGTARINLIGYSGGATVALLVASRRHDVASIKTLAGNLDPVAVNRYHHVSPLAKSQSPLDIADDLANIPQIHFIGANDKTIPEFISRNYFESSGKSACVETIQIEGATHEKGWVENAMNIISKVPSC